METAERQRDQCLRDIRTILLNVERSVEDRLNRIEETVARRRELYDLFLLYFHLFIRTQLHFPIVSSTIPPLLTFRGTITMFVWRTKVDVFVILL
jgi:hypothetical protein